MKILSIKLKNIGPYTDFSMDFTGEENVIEGMSRTGKTTVLNAIETLFSNSRNSLCKSMIKHGTSSGEITLKILVGSKEHTVVRVIGGGSSLIADEAANCSSQESLIEYLKLTPSDLNGIKVEKFFNGMTSREKRDLYLSTKGMEFPTMEGLEESENPISDKEAEIKFIKAQVSNLEEVVLKEEDVINVRLKEFEEDIKMINREDILKTIKSLEDKLPVLEDNKKKALSEYEEVSKSVVGAENKVRDLKKEVVDLDRDINSLKSGKCHFCGKDFKDDSKLKSLEDSKKEKEELIAKGNAAIISRKKKKEEALKKMNESSDPIKEVASEVSKLKETLKRLDDGSIIEALRTTLIKNEKKLEGFKSQLKKDEEILATYKDKVIPDFEKTINESLKTFYFKKGDVKIRIMDDLTKKLCFEVYYFGRSFNSLCGEETIFAKIEMAANMGSECVLMDGLESGGDDEILNKLCKDTGIQIIGTRRIQPKKVKASAKKLKPNEATESENNGGNDVE